MSDKVTQLEEEDVKTLQKLFEADATAKRTAEKAEVDAKMATLEFNNVLLRVYLKYGLNQNCNIAIGTGKVEWPTEAPVAPPEVTAVPVA